MSTRNRTGFSLAEIMVALVLLGIVCGGIMTVIMRQQTFYRSATDVIDTRQQIRQATTVVPVDLRGVSSVGGDILQMSDSALEVRANIGSGVVCSHTVSQITIPPSTITNGRAFTSFLTRPQAHDVVMVFNDSTPGNQDDTWQVVTITSVDSTLVGCTNFTDAVTDAARYRYRYNVAPNLSTLIIDGAPVRFARRSKYATYKSASDNLWWLGYRECRGDGTSCDPSIQPVSGPYRPYVANDTVNSGISFVYRDQSNAVTNVAANVARIELFVHGETQGAVSLGGGTAAKYRDYQKVTIAIRNRQ
jgi:prepilin-type N-terminal cleavage/methylation domain-containing protein